MLGFCLAPTRTGLGHFSAIADGHRYSSVAVICAWDLTPLFCLRL